MISIFVAHVEQDIRPIASNRCMQAVQLLIGHVSFRDLLDKDIVACFQIRYQLLPEITEPAADSVKHLLLRYVSNPNKRMHSHPEPPIYTTKFRAFTQELSVLAEPDP